MSECVNLPPNSGSDPDLPQQELMPRHHIINHILIVSARLIVHGPAGIYELELAVLREVAHLPLGVLVLLLPPHLKELHLHLRILPLRVLNQLGYRCVQGHFHVRILDVRSAPREVPVHGFLPPEVVVGVRDQVHIQLGPVGLLGVGVLVVSLEEASLFPMVGMVNVGLVPVFLLAGLGETQGKQG